MADGDTILTEDGDEALTEDGDLLLHDPALHCCYKQLYKCSDNTASGYWLNTADISGSVFRRDADGSCYYPSGPEEPCPGTLAGAGTWFNSCLECEDWEDPVPCNVNCLELAETYHTNAAPTGDDCTVPDPLTHEPVQMCSDCQPGSPAWDGSLNRNALYPEGCVWTAAPNLTLNHETHCANGKGLAGWYTRVSINGDGFGVCWWELTVHCVGDEDPSGDKAHSNTWIGRKLTGVTPIGTYDRIAGCNLTPTYSVTA